MKAKQKSTIKMPNLNIPDFVPYDCLEVNKATGGPRKFKTPEELQVKIKAFFEDCYERGVHPTITGLALFLESSRKTIFNYTKDSAFYPLLKKAKELCGHYLEQRAISGNAVAGEIFLLKANHEYREETVVNVNVSLDVEKLYSKALRNTQKQVPELSECASKRIGQVEVLEDNSDG